MAIPRIVVASALAILTLLGPTASAVGKAKIDKVVYNPPGKDTGTNTHLNEEILVLRNNGDAPIEIGGWIVESNDKEYTFATGTRIASDSTVILHTGRGSDTKRGLGFDCL